MEDSIRCVTEFLDSCRRREFPSSGRAGFCYFSLRTKKSMKKYCLKQKEKQWTHRSLKRDFILTVVPPSSESLRFEGLGRSDSVWLSESCKQRLWQGGMIFDSMREILRKTFSGCTAQKAEQPLNVLPLLPAERPSVWKSLVWLLDLSRTFLAQRF